MDTVWMVEFRVRGKNSVFFDARRFFSTEEKAQAFADSWTEGSAWVTQEDVD